jgi:hypothetical protein
MTRHKPKLATLSIVALAAALGLYLALLPPAVNEHPVATSATRSDPATQASPTEAAGATQPSHSPAEPPKQVPPQPPPTAAPGATKVEAPALHPVAAGPLDELKHMFETQPRESAAPDLERRIEAEFRQPDMPAGLLQSVLCRSSVCRLKLRWSPERHYAYNGALFRLLHIFGQGVGVDPEALDRNGELPIDVYMRRHVEPPTRPTAATPTDQR